MHIGLGPAWAELRHADELFSTYRPDSEISRLGRGEIALANCSPEVDEVLARCAELSERTDGYFSVRATGTLDPSGLVKGWAVDRAARALRAAGLANFAINAAGAPAGLLAVTVAGPELPTADALATAVFAMGAAGPQWALRLVGYEALCITDREAVLSAPGMDGYRRPAR